jgi:hypothetical protein
MRRPGLVLVTVGTLLLTGLTLVQAGWFDAGAAATRPAKPESATFATDVPWNWRDCGPRHWRGCLLNP